MDSRQVGLRELKSIADEGNCANTRGWPNPIERLPSKRRDHIEVLLGVSDAYRSRYRDSGDGIRSRRMARSLGERAGLGENWKGMGEYLQAILKGLPLGKLLVLS
jgi:hypothetical protein